jgi:hypothetical protein
MVTRDREQELAAERSGGRAGVGGDEVAGEVSGGSGRRRDWIGEGFIGYFVFERTLLDTCSKNHYIIR